MTISWLPVVWIDILGSLTTLVLAVLCSIRSKRWTQSKPDDTFCHYIFLLAVSLAIFAVSRSIGHLVRQCLLYLGLAQIWVQISPFSGSVNTACFIVVFSVCIYFQRSQKINLVLNQKNVQLLNEISERKEAEQEREKLIDELHGALVKVKTLSGLLPICSHCKNIRDDKGYWSKIESYIHKHSGTEFSHGICPECAKKYYPDMDLYEDAK